MMQGRAIGAERPEALAYIAREFFERRNLFLVSRESGVGAENSRPSALRRKQPSATAIETGGFDP